LGLVDSTDVSDFASKLITLEERWNSLEASGKRVQNYQVMNQRVLQLVYIQGIVCFFKIT